MYLFSGRYKINKYDVLKLDKQVCFPLYAATRQVINLYNPLSH